MDPATFFLNNRPGSRKAWDELSNDHKRKIRKVYFDSLDSKFDINQSNSNSDSNLISNSIFSKKIKNNEAISDNIIENNEQNTRCDLYTSSNRMSQSNDNDQTSILNFQSTLIPPILDNNNDKNLISIETPTIVNYEQHNSASSFSKNTNINSAVNNESNRDIVTTNNKTIIKECTNTHKPTNILSFEETFKLNLSNCIVNNKINQVQTNALLNVLRTHPLLKFLPKDSRSLLKTPRDKIEVKNVEPGEYIHLGLEVMLKSILSRVPFESVPSKLLIDFSTDGAELNKETQMWPIQFRIVNLALYDKPELVGMYKGKEKPKSSTNFFLDFVNEVNLIQQKGGITYNNKIIPVELRCFIADAPARAYVLNHYGHNSLYLCSKCHVQGVQYIKAKRFLGINFQLRTNESYRLLKDVDHNKGKSALHNLTIDLVQQVPFDYMHLVCLGVMKKVIESLVFGSCKPEKLPLFKKKIVSNRFTTLQLYCPREFAQNPRELDQFTNFKATEFRQLLLYTFMVVFRGIITDDQYNNFLLLHSSMRVLLNPSCSPQYLKFADESLKKFVLNAEDVHGLQFLTYNSHGLLHLVSDYKLYGPLDSVSAFPYENKMLKFREFVRKPDKPLQQLYRRIQEESQFPDTSEDQTKKFKARSSHNCGPIPKLLENISSQYEHLQTPSFFFSIQNTDNTIITQNDQIGIIKNIFFCKNEYYFAVYFFKDLEPFYTVSNLPSTDFGVFLCTSLNNSQAIIITYYEIKSKCYRMPLWINKPFLNTNVNDEQLNNAYISVVM